MFISPAKFTLVTLSLLFLSACGGGSSSTPVQPITTVTPPGAQAPTNEWQQGTFSSAEQFHAQCTTPRVGVDLNGNAYDDVQGTAQDEKMWLRSWSHETYLWYDEIDDVDPSNYATPQDYFGVLRTTQTTDSGAVKDNFHFFQSTEEFQSFSQSGTATGYGIDWVFLRSSPPRDIKVSTIQPNSAAALAGLQRGDQLLTIDDVSVIDSSDIDFLNQATFPSTDEESYEFTFRRVDGTEYTTTLVSGTVTSVFVNNVQVIDTDAGKVGYLRFDAFRQTAQAPLISGFQQFVDENVTDLVLDLRYNGGGLLAMSSQLAYMVAGSAQTNGRTFETLQFNNRIPNTNPVTGETVSPIPFYDKEIEWGVGLTDNDLPALDLTRVFVITTAGSCSASEALINSLRGIDVEVIQIGDRTCGKPFGFYPTDNCGTTYFTVQFQGVNDKGYGDYVEGFKPVDVPMFDDELPGCIVADDFSKLLGDQDEGMLAATVSRLTSGECPQVASERGTTNKISTPKYMENTENTEINIMDTRYRSFLLENKIYTPIETKGK